MDRRKFIAGTGGVAGILAASTAPAVHAQNANIRWRLASSFPKALDTLYGAAETFAKKVSELSGGRFVISTHAAGELMPAFGIVDGVQQGAVEYLCSYLEESNCKVLRITLILRISFLA